MKQEPSTLKIVLVAVLIWLLVTALVIVLFPLTKGEQQRYINSRIFHNHLKQVQ